MKRRIVGLDLNGRIDFAARDWRDDGEGAATEVVRGKTCSSIITLMSGDRIGGPQANLAPHGRGHGWGKIGDPSRRSSLSTSLDRLSHQGEDVAKIGAAVDALTRGSEEVVAAVPDLPDFAEAAQGAMIKAMSGRRRRVMLLSRPVAAFLDLLGGGPIGGEALGARIRFLVHTGAGFEDQVLTLRADPDHPEHRAPQRDGSGHLSARELGLDAIFARAEALVRESNGEVDWNRSEASRLGPALVCGEASTGDAEVLRATNGTWAVVTAPELESNSLGIRPVALSHVDVPVAATFLVTPLVSQLAQALVAAVSESAGPVTLVSPEAVARGCLAAGRLIERGLPHYFDRLEPVAIAVLRGSEPDFEYLIPVGSVVPANREFVSREIGGFEWARDKADTEFYIVKGDREVRHWEVTMPHGPPASVPVTLRIRQTPGQSWARLTVGSQSWDALSQHPIALDWETLTPLDLSAEDVLEKLRTPPPTVPKRIVERSHIALWNGAPWAGNGLPARYALGSLDNAHVPPDSWTFELRRPRRSPDPPRERFWLVGTDGDLPTDLSPEVREGFRLASGRLAELVCSATLQNPPPDNHPLAALTWCFALCPTAVQERLLDALEANAEGRRHPLTEHSGSMTVARQGAGRVVTGVPRLQRLFRYLEHAPLDNNTINALAMALTRRAEAPDALTREQVDDFLLRLGKELVHQIDRLSFKTKFRNTLSAIAGLFRWRLREPYALLAERDHVAGILRDTLISAKEMLERNGGAIPQREQKVAQIDAIIEYLDGRGDPDILRHIENDDDDDGS